MDLTLSSSIFTPTTSSSSAFSLDTHRSRSGWDNPPSFVSNGTLHNASLVEPSKHSAVLLELVALAISPPVVGRFLGLL